MEQTIEQLMAENAALRKALRESGTADIQIAIQLRVLLDELTRLGPATTARVMNFSVGRYMKTSTFYEHDFFDRRPKLPVATPPPPPPPAEEPPPQAHGKFVPRTSEKIHTCQECGAGPFSIQGLGGHTWKKHQKRLSDAPPPA